jgi:para-nitrobenzyl esterase
VGRDVTRPPTGDTRVPTTAGTVQGFVRDGIARWRSIPYARPPAGRLRFRAPEPPLPWRGVRYCDEFGYCAPQDPRYTYTGIGGRQPMSEDCLTLNVAAPAKASDGPRPVMFFIHGGGYMFGSSATSVYDGAAIARRGAAYVSANYRLGALGCLDLSSLSTAEHPLEDNLFLRDLVMALRWVRDNVAEFGGDFTFGATAWELAEAHAQHAPTYHYRYDYAPRRCSGPASGPPTRANCWPSSMYTTRGWVAC